MHTFIVFYYNIICICITNPILCISDDVVQMGDEKASITSELGKSVGRGAEKEKNGLSSLIPHGLMEQETHDSVAPLPREVLSVRSRKSKLMPTHSDDNDSAVSMVRR